MSVRQITNTANTYTFLSEGIIKALTASSTASGNVTSGTSTACNALFIFAKSPLVESNTTLAHSLVVAVPSLKVFTNSLDAAPALSCTPGIMNYVSFRYEYKIIK